MAVITDKTPLKSWIPIINSNTTTSKEASTTASSALSTANTAVSKADAAQSSADSAMAAATAAQSRADTAATAAERKATETVFGNVQVTNDYTSGGLAENSIASSPTAVNRLFDDVLAAANQAANSVGGSISNDVAANLSASISALNLRADDIEDSIEVLENPVATGSTTARTLQNRFADVVNVKDFGAKGTRDAYYDASNILVGTAINDAPAFKAALEEVNKRGGGTVFVPAGKYSIQNILYMGPNTTILCADGAELYKDSTSGFLHNSLGIDESTSTMSGYEGHGNIAIIGGVWDMCGYAYEGNKNGFTIGYADGVTFKDMSIRNGLSFHAIDMSSCKNVLIENCEFLGAIVEIDYIEAIQFDHNAPDSFQWGARNGSPNKNVTIRGCYCGVNPERPADGTWKVFVGSHGGHKNCVHENIVIDGCRAEGVKRFVHSYGGWKNYKITNCTIYDGNLLQAAYYGETNNYSDGTSRGDNGVLISGNTCYENGLGAQAGFAVYFNTSDLHGTHKNIIISDNVFEGSVYCATCEDIGISGCKITKTVASPDQGIMFYRSLKRTVVNNTLFDPTKITIQMSAGDTEADFGNDKAIIVGNYLRNGQIFANEANSDFLISGNIFYNDVLNSTALQFNSTDGFIFVDGNVFCSTVEGRTNLVGITSYADQITFGQNRVIGYTLLGSNNGSHSRASASGPLILQKFGTNNTEGIAAICFGGYSATYNPQLAFKEGENFRIATYTDESLAELKTFTTLLTINTTQILPGIDEVVDLGSATNRFNNVYAATGAINTSDAREKTSVSAPDEALMRAWGKVDFKSFQFTDAVEKKGEDARIHFGVIAQQVQEAFASEGLDATRYALFCYDKWDDEYEDVEVVDTEAVLDEQGNEVTPAVTYTEKRLVTPAGDRYGIRYSEALALECAYQRWRLDKLEAQMNNM